MSAAEKRTGAALEVATREPAHATLSLRTRLTVSFLAIGLLPIATFGLIVLAVRILAIDVQEANLGRLVLFAVAATALLAVFGALALAADLATPLRRFTAAVDRVSAGDLSSPIIVSGDDELARLADSHHRLAADLERRNRELAAILAALDRMSLRDGAEALARRAGEDARAAFGMLDAVVILLDPDSLPEDEWIPGTPRPVRAELRAGGERLGVLMGRLPVDRRWERADQDLVELFATEVAAAIRNAELFDRIAAQNTRLVELAAAKDDFLRGISHNLQTPLTSIRAYAEQLARERPDPRLAIIGEQSERLSRMVRQLLTVSRIESGTLRPRSEVLALGPRVRRAWDALGASDVPFTLDDRSGGWLAVADPDQTDQVLWALLDNAVKHGGRAPVTVAIRSEGRLVRLTVTDGGPGIAAGDGGRLFARFSRGSSTSTGGSGLGLYVSRELCRAMGGDLVLDAAEDPEGSAPASFSVLLPAEAAADG